MQVISPLIYIRISQSYSRWDQPIVDHGRNKFPSFRYFSIFFNSTKHWSPTDWIPRPYLTGDTAALLCWHQSKTKVYEIYSKNMTGIFATFKTPQMRKGQTEL